jgi:hypothetical protein
MKRTFAALSLVLCGASLWLFYQCVLLVARRDYVGAILVMFMGFAGMRGGSELARLAMGNR